MARWAWVLAVAANVAVAMRIADENVDGNGQGAQNSPDLTDPNTKGVGGSTGGSAGQQSLDKPPHQGMEIPSSTGGNKDSSSGGSNSGGGMSGSSSMGSSFSPGGQQQGSNGGMGGGGGGGMSGGGMNGGGMNNGQQTQPMSLMQGKVDAAVRALEARARRLEMWATMKGYDPYGIMNAMTKDPTLSKDGPKPSGM
eukprot:TRINITY_DN2789_c0_g1_i2.p1 TRINITY_DN2789_c0_g1~~TRINITY_DN2789_c0_g1_i2.p1  ORF type:complete len:196 (-),score=61.64 TRINITY_DN2789_c0_g1_i2:212-799(-)